MSDVTIVRTTGGLAKPLPNADFISGLLVILPAAQYPNLTSNSDLNNIAFNSLVEAELLGVTKAGENAILWYHIAEYFRVATAGKLYIKVIASETFDGTYLQIGEMQSFAEGEIKQFGVYEPTSTDITGSIQLIAGVLDILENESAPTVAVYAPRLLNTEIATLTDIKTLARANVAVILGEDMAGFAPSLYDFNPLLKTVSCIGACLGAVAKSKVSESIAWIEKQNLVTAPYPQKTSAELDVIQLATTPLKSLLKSQVQTIVDKGYILPIKHVGITGTYFSSDATATLVTDDFNNIRANRTYNKGSRSLRKVLLPKLSGPVELTAEGNIKAEFIAYLKGIGSEPLQAMLEAKEISAFSIDINPNQKILSSQTLTIIVNIVPIGIASDIVVNLGFTVSIA